VLAAGLEHEDASKVEAALPWDAVCDGAYCIVVTTPSGKLRWPSLLSTLQGAELLERTTAVVNLGPCDEKNQPCECRMKGLSWSHLLAIKHARSRGLKRALLLEDDVYFVRSDLERLLHACAASPSFQLRQIEAAALYLGGVYTSMVPTQFLSISGGRSYQMHAYVATVEHPGWSKLAEEVSTSQIMIDVAMHNHAGPCWLAHPSVAFQRPFNATRATTWSLVGLPALHSTLTRLMGWLGIGNCWEGCARTTNKLVEIFGSIGNAMAALAGALVLVVSAFWGLCCR